MIQQTQVTYNTANLIKQKEIISECLDSKPLDFSFKDIQNLEELKKVQSRQGKRKQIKLDEPKKEDVKNIQKDDKKQIEQNHENQQQQQQDAADVQAGDGGGGAEDGDRDDKEEKQAKEKEKNNANNKKKDDIKKSPEALIPQVSFAQNLIQQQNIPINSVSGKNQSGKNLENKNNTSQQCVMINRVCVTLTLSQNKIRSIADFYPVMDSIMFNVKRLQWIDISYNYLERLDYDFKDFPHLQTLYLHCNYLKQLKDLEQVLKHLENLKSLTIHGNPIEQIQNFRYHIIGVLNQLKRIDSVLVSKKEKDNSQVFLKQFKIAPKVPDTVRKPPEIKQVQNLNQSDPTKLN